MGLALALAALTLAACVAGACRPNLRIASILRAADTVDALYGESAELRLEVLGVEFLDETRALVTKRP